MIPATKVADFACRHGVTRWQVYDGRRKLGSGKFAVPVSAMSEAPFPALVEAMTFQTVTAPAQVWREDRAGG
jgi:hypothetical protein